VEVHITLQIMAVLVVLVLGAQAGSGASPNTAGGNGTANRGAAVVEVVLALAAQLSPVVQRRLWRSRYQNPITKTATFTGGVTETNSTAGGYTTYIVTATSTLTKR
jgi:hypothetical protein